MADAITEAIATLTDRVFAYRITRIILRGTAMPLEIKGLRGKALKAAANLDRLNQAYDAFNEAAPAHAADVEGLTPQIAALQDDLTFATQILGNSVAGSNSGAGQEKAKETPVQLPAPPVAQQSQEPPAPQPIEVQVATQAPPAPRTTPMLPSTDPNYIFGRPRVAE